MNYRFNAKLKVNKHCDLITFKSLLEKRSYSIIDRWKAAGYVQLYLLQPPIHLAPKLRYTPDFLVFYSNGTAEFIEVKGYETEAARVRRLAAQHKIGVPIRMLFKAEVDELEKEWPGQCCPPCAENACLELDASTDTVKDRCHVCRRKTSVLPVVVRSRAGIRGSIPSNTTQTREN